MLNKWSDLKFWKSFYSHGGLDQKLTGTNSLPKKKDWFRALELTPPDKVKVVILGQDPYPRKGNADGLAFSVQPHVTPLPASLENIFKEYSDDLGYPPPSHGDLSSWAKRGVLLLNTILTVKEGKPLSHEGIGWEKLTYEIVSSLSREREGIVWLLWGKRAEEYRPLIDETRHRVLVSGHPSPISVRLFRGTKPFSRANELLKEMGKEPIDWKLQ